MTAIDRTAYPRPGARLTREELGARYKLSDTDFAFIRASARGDAGRMLLAILLKTRQDLGYFAASDEVHADTAAYLESQMGLTIPPVLSDEEPRTKTLYRYQAAVRAHLSVTPYTEAGERLISSTTLEAAETMSDPADLINRAIEALLAAAIDLPAFSTLDRRVNRLRAEVHRRIFDRVAARLTAEHVSALETLLTKPPNSPTTSFNRLKQAPGPATPKTIDLWINRLDWLVGVLDPDPLLEGIAHTKLRQFAAEATALEVNDLLDISQPGMLSMSASLPSDGKVSSANASPDLAPSSDARLRSASSSIWRMPCRAAISTSLAPRILPIIVPSFSLGRSARSGCPPTVPTSASPHVERTSPLRSRMN